jgi:hypothetical protein
MLGRIFAYWSSCAALSSCAIVTGPCELKQERLSCAVNGTMVLFIPAWTIAALGEAVAKVQESSPVNQWIQERPNEGP